MTMQPTQKTCPTGRLRSGVDASVRFDLITPIGLHRLAEACAQGAAKYGDHDWLLHGLPASYLMNHALRHLCLWLAGEEDEDHLAHAAWNILAICHFEETMPEMIDVRSRNKTNP